MIFAKEISDLVNGFPAWRSESTKTLICTHDAMHKKLLNELLSTLIFSYREGAHERDNRNRLPLHEALWYGVEMDTIALFLMAKPEATNEVDHRGRSLADLNKHRSGLNKKAVQHLLNQSPAFGRVLEQRHHFDSVSVHCPKRRRLRAVVAIQSYPSLETQNQRRQSEIIRIAKPLV